MNKLTAAILIVAAIATHVVPHCLAQASGEGSGRLAAEWNELVLRVAEAEDGFLTLKGLRTVAMMHLAMHDALNAIHRRYEPFVLDDSVTAADPLSAAVQAASVVASNQYPSRAGRFDTLKSAWMNTLGESAVNERGIERGFELGERAARTILAMREGDGWDNEAEYTMHPMAPGVYAEFPEHSDTPEGFVFGAGWATAMPFVLDGPDHFKADPPPPIESEAYTEALLEVKEVGRFQSSVRTVDQTHIALWWKDFVENSHNRLARQLVVKEGVDLVDATRLFALLNMALFDTYVNSFYNKFAYNHWRPYTAIRWAENDGNPETEPEQTWTNTHLHTYAFPSYPSAHGMVCSAAATVLADTFGDDYPFTMTTEMVDVTGPFSGKIEMRPATRRFETFSDAAMECALSRVYLGIHFRYDSIVGNELGHRIGAFVVANALRPR